jgi:hypothetical protein
MKSSPFNRPDGKGFGHMGLFDAQIVVQTVEDVVAVDSSEPFQPGESSKLLGSEAVGSAAALHGSSRDNAVEGVVGRKLSGVRLTACKGPLLLDSSSEFFAVFLLFKPQSSRQTPRVASCVSVRSSSTTVQTAELY